MLWNDVSIPSVPPVGVDLSLPRRRHVDAFGGVPAAGPSNADSRAKRGTAHAEHRTRLGSTRNYFVLKNSAG
jgi:hypothetical protein